MTGIPTIFHGTFVHSTKEDDMVIHNDMILGVKRGKIIFIEHETRLPDLMSEYSVPCDNVRHLEKWQFLIPGLVDTHIHAPQYAFTGSNIDLQLYDWLKTYTYPTEAKFKDLTYAMEVYSKVVTRTLKNGTTTACYFATLHRDTTNLLLQVIEEAGQRAFVGKVNMDYCSTSYYRKRTEESVEETKKLRSGFLDVRNVLEKGCKIGLATGGYSSSMLDALRSTSQVSKTIAIQREERGENYQILSYKELFRLATLGGSEVMGLDDIIGNFQVGKDFDAIMVDPFVENSPFDVFSTDTFPEIIQKFLFLGDDRNMIDVFVAGTRVSGR